MAFRFVFVQDMFYSVCERLVQHDDPLGYIFMYS